MAADAIEFFLDLSTPQGRLVRGLTDATQFALGPFYQGQLLKLRIYPVVPTGNTLGTLFSKLALDTLDLQAVVGPRAGAEGILAAQYVWTKQVNADADGKSGYFYADLDLNTVELNTAIANADSYPTFFEILLSRAGSTFRTVFNSSITVTSVVKGPASANAIPTPAASYLTAAECFNLFVLWHNELRAANAGKGIILVSPSANHTREVAIQDDGSITDNVT